MSLPARHRTPNDKTGHPAPSARRTMTTRTGLFLPPRLTIDAWKEIGEELSVLWDSSTWWQGDWLVYGQDHYPDRYQRALDESGLDYQTLRNYAWVARRFPSSRRRGLLSLQHHAEVASLSDEDQDHWLDRAEKERWSRNRLRRSLQEHEVGGRRLGAADGTLAIKVPSIRRDRWLKAAERHGKDLASWVALVLDEAAARDLRSRELSRPAAPQLPAPRRRSAETTTRNDRRHHDQRTGPGRRPPASARDGVAPAR